MLITLPPLFPHCTYLIAGRKQQAEEKLRKLAGCIFFV